MFQVSRFSILRLFTIYALGLEHYRYDLHPAVLMPGSNDPIGSFWVVSMWLRDSSESQVSISVHFHLINISRYDFDLTTLMPGSNDSVQAF